MIPVEIYSIVYYFILSTIILLGIFPLFVKPNLESFPTINLKVTSVLLVFTTILFIGLRDPFGNWRYLGDTSQYTNVFFNFIDDPIYGIKSDYGFYLLMLFSKEYLNIYIFYIVCALLYVIPIYLVCKKYLDKYSLFAFIMFVSSMSFWSFGINGVRNGLATSIFLLGIYFYEKKWLMYSFMILSLSFHKSMILPFLAFLIAMKATNTFFLIRIWIVLVIVSYVFGSQVETFMSDFLLNSQILEDKRVDTYFSDEIDGEFIDRRYRLDLIIYSGIAILLAYYYKYKKGFNDIFYNRIVNTYIIANAIWVLLIYAAFTNRIAYLSWFIMPLVLVYPLIKNENLVKKQNLFIGLLVLGSLTFTLLIFFK